MVQLCLIKYYYTNTHVEVEAEHMVLTKTMCEKLLCVYIECVAAWLSKHLGGGTHLLQVSNAICILKCEVSKQRRNIPVTETDNYIITGSIYFDMQCTTIQTYQTQILVWHNLELNCLFKSYLKFTV